MSDWVDFQARKYEDEPRWLSWLKVQEQAVYMLDPEEEDEEELWARSVARNGFDEQVFSFVDYTTSRHMLESDHGYYRQSTVTMEVEETSQHDWIESQTIAPDGTERNEFKESSVHMADRPNEDFFLKLGGLHYVMDGYARYIKYNLECPECHIFTPKNLDTCQNCDKKLVSI